MPKYIPERFYGKFRIVPAKRTVKYKVQERIDFIIGGHWWKDMIEMAGDYEIVRWFQTVQEAKEAIDAAIQRSLSEDNYQKKEVIYYP